jgi:hypothetical protein
VSIACGHLLTTEERISQIARSAIRSEGAVAGRGWRAAERRQPTDREDGLAHPADTSREPRLLLLALAFELAAFRTPLVPSLLKRGTHGVEVQEEVHRLLHHSPHRVACALQHERRERQEPSRTRRRSVRVPLHHRHRHLVVGTSQQQNSCTPEA